jgi:hypothetical protein
MVVPVVRSAQRYREFVADLASHRAGLGEPQVMGVGGASPANQTWLRCHEFEVRFIAMPTWLTDRKLLGRDPFAGDVFVFCVRRFAAWHANDGRVADAYALCVSRQAQRC